jgi:uncharacterized membrane protein
MSSAGDKQSMRRHATWFSSFSASGRLALAVAAGLLPVLVEPGDWGGRLHFLSGWDAGAVVYLGLAWAVIGGSNGRTTRTRARTQDVGAHAIFVLVLTAAFASTAAIAVLIGDVKDLPRWQKAADIGLTLVALTTSWLLIHTLYAFHYARRFYAQPGDPEAEPRGLNFPGGGNPDYFDFAYYAFVVGMTSQVSDVTINARHMRRLTLIHSVVSFVFNIAVLALSINILVSVI